MERPIMKNLHYFQYSQNNVDEFIDLSKAEGVLVVAKNEQEHPTPLMEANKKLIDLITTYETLINLAPDTINKVLDSIIDLIENSSSINYTAFCAYFQVVGFSYGTYMGTKNSMTVDEKRELMKTLVELYIKNRHQIYKYLGYSDQVLQVNSDLASSRRKGKTGIEKIEEIIAPLGFVRVRNIYDLKHTELCYLLPDKGDKILFNQFLNDNDIKFEFRISRQMKNPDMFLKIGNEFIILEHKLTNGGGGSQNAEINEIIQFINYCENKGNWHYVSCLQGDFFSKLKHGNREPKAQSQYNDIMKALKLYEVNYFVNGKGLEKLIDDYLDNFSLKKHENK